MIFDIHQFAPAVSAMSVAIIGVSALMIVAAWKGYKQSYLSISTPRRQASKRASLVAFSLIFILIGATTVTGIYASTMAVRVYFGVIIMFAAMIVLSLIAAGILRKSRKFRRPESPDTICSLYHFSLVLNVAGILCNIFLLLGITTTLLNVKMGSIQGGNIALTKWLALDGLVCFVFVICATGAAYFLCKGSQLKTITQADH